MSAQDMSAQDMGVHDMGVHDMGAELPAEDQGLDMTAPDMAVQVWSPETFTTLAARAYCEAMSRCCDDASQELLLGPVKGSPLYSPVASQLPLDAARCPAAMKQLLELKPFGSWLEAVAQAGVVFDADAARVCGERLSRASCGKPVLDALYDATCFAPFSPPEGGQQRAMFKRVASPGERCVALNDGFSGQLYGSCEASQGFCCFKDDQGRCGLPGASAHGEGSCQEASAVTQSCSFDVLGGVQLCKLGLECNTLDERARCDLPAQLNPAQLGQVCATSISRVTAQCQSSWCDAGGSDRCEPLKPLDAPCFLPFECQSGSCEQGKCADLSFFCAGR